jgi:hypothetical protein
LSSGFSNCLSASGVFEGSVEGSVEGSAVDAVVDASEGTVPSVCSSSSNRPRAATSDLRRSSVPWCPPMAACASR